MPYPAKLNPEQILDAAQIVLETDGPEALTMRTLADALGVRPSSLYRHFENQGVLLRALGDRAALALKAQVEQAAAGKAPRQALASVASEYLNYNRKHPHLYALLLEKSDDMPTPESAGKQLWNTLLALVGAVSGDPEDTDHAVAFWTFLHGFAELERSGMFGASGPKGGLDVGLTALFNHMEQSAQSRTQPG